MVVILGFIRNPQAVLLLAACPTPKSDRLLARRELEGDARFRARLDSP
jgi:hypothetical protein